MRSMVEGAGHPAPTVPKSPLRRLRRHLPREDTGEDLRMRLPSLEGEGQGEG